jgi:hypothetical protein
MDLATPLFPPPPGRMWHLHRNVAVWSGSGDINLGPLPEGNDADGIWHENFHGRAHWTEVSNFHWEGADDPDMYELGRWINAVFEIYSDGALVATMAIEPGVSAASPVLNILEQDVLTYYSAPPSLWPVTLDFTTTSHGPHPVDSGTIGWKMLGGRGDVWVAEPACDSYDCLLGDAPDGGGDGCPPPCENATTGALNAAHDQLAESITVGWARKESRIDPTLFALGQRWRELHGHGAGPRRLHGDGRIPLDQASPDRRRRESVVFPYQHPPDERYGTPHVAALGSHDGRHPVPARAYLGQRARHR